MMDLLIEDLGAAEFLASYEGLVPESSVFALEFGNAVDYALYLQDRHGYFVIDEAHLAETVAAFLGRLFDGDGPVTDAAVERALMDAAEAEVVWLTEFIGRMRPPLDEGEPHRPARQGGWADRTTALVGGFYARVGDGPVTRFPVPAVAYRGSDGSVGHNQPA